MKVLLGIGGGDDSVRALEQTVSRAAEAGDDLTVAVVDDHGTDQPTDDIEAEVDRVLEAATVEAEVRHVDGDAGSELVRIAESEGFDRIALGGGTTSPMGKIQLGSTAQFVLLNAHTTVSLVR
jgi:nucleotide-binding universal stress UspA family protein